MHITHESVAGTLESSDALVKASPHDALDISVASSVMAQYGQQIRSVVEDTLRRAGVETGMFIIEDKGALDPTLRARVQAAVERGTGETLDWSVL